MTDDKLLALAERCEQATGPSSPLDHEIEQALFLPEQFMGQPVVRWQQYAFKSGFSCETSDGFFHVDAVKVPSYTASLDAAMTLIDDQTFFHMSRFSPECDGRAEVHVYPNRYLGDDYFAEAATLPLALCAASLRAIAGTHQ